MRGRRSILRRFGMLCGVACLLPASSPLAQSETPAVRVASLVPAATEVLFAIGAGDRVVAVGDFDDYPPAVAALPRVGGLVDPNLEAILAATPDLVIVDPAQGGLIAQLRNAGIDAYPYATGGLVELLAHMRALGQRLGLEQQATLAADTLAAALEAMRHEGAVDPRPSALIVFGRRSGSFAELWVSGGVGALHEIVALAGGDNVFGDVARPSFKSGLEGVLSRVPDVVIEAVVGLPDSGLPDSGLPDNGLPTIESEWRALPGFGAVRVIVLTEAWMVRPTPRAADLVRFIADRLHPSQRP